VGIVGKSYLLSLVKGKSDLLRMPKELAADLGGDKALEGTVTMADGRKLVARFNAIDRTVIGFGPWLKPADEDNARSVRLTGTEDRPVTFRFEFSEEPAKVVDSNDGPMERPEEGFYLGGELLPEFYELIRTNRPMALDRSDLLRHVFICGATGSGKTVLAKVLIEEAARIGIPTIAVDLKGDISSMANVFSGEEPAELVPWVGPESDQSREERAATIAERQRAALARWGLGDSDVEDFKSKVAVNIFTPRSNAGFRLALSAFVEPPSDLEQLREKDPDSFENIIEFMANTFVSRLTLTKKQQEKAKAYTHEIVRTFWNRGVSLRGYDGIKRVLDEVRKGDGGIEQIGGMATAEYISSKDRENISAAINNLLAGAQNLWFQGFPLDVQQLIAPKNFNGKTSITIVNIKHLGFADQAYVVGYIAYQIWFWMKRLPGTETPRLIFYVDEIGGGGGKQAFFPSVAISPSKPALNQLLREGRASGVCCMYATQSPGDIDYKALGQCGTWAVGQLRRQRERKKIEEGAGVAEVDFELASKHIASLGTGQFFITAPSLKQTFLEERWLMHLHRVLSSTEIENVKGDYEKDARGLLKEAGKCRAVRDLRKAKQILESIVRVFRFSAICAGASVQLGEVLYEMSDYENAIRHLQEMTKYRLEAEEAGQAYFLIGKCMEQQDRFEDASREFGKVSDSAADEKIKQHALTHGEYCTNRAQWPKLTNVEKFCWWIVGKKPDPASLVRLQAKDRELLDEEFREVLEKEDFAIPDPIDYQALLDAKQRAAEAEGNKVAARIRTERWACDQVPNIETLLSKGTLEEAARKCRKIVQRLKDADAIAADSVIGAIESCNKQSVEKEEELGHKLRCLDARQFEFEIAHLFQLRGYKSSATRVTGDDGVDVFAWRDDEKIIVQCKRWKHPVGRNIIDELAGVRSRHDADRAIVATISSFSKGAIEAGQKHQIELWDFERIRREWQEALWEGM